MMHYNKKNKVKKAEDKWTLTHYKGDFGCKGNI